MKSGRCSRPPIGVSIAGLLLFALAWAAPASLAQTPAVSSEDVFVLKPPTVSTPAEHRDPPGATNRYTTSSSPSATSFTFKDRYENRGELMSDWVFSFSWTMPPQVLRPGDTLKFVVRGTAVGAKQAMLNFAEFYIAAPGFDMKQTGGGKLFLGNIERGGGRVELVASAGATYDLVPKPEATTLVLEIATNRAGQVVRFEYARQKAQPATPPAPAPPVVTKVDPPATPSVRPPSPPAAASRDDWERYDNTLQLVARVQRRLEQVAIQLTLSHKAAADLGERIRFLESAVNDPLFNVETRGDIADKLAAFKRNLAEVEQATDSLIDQARVELREAGLRIRHALDRSRDEHDPPQIISRMREMVMWIEEQEQIAPLRLLLAGGRRQRFDAEATALTGREPRTTATVFELRAADYVANGDARLALFAARKAAEANPAARNSRIMLQSLETGYLRAVASKLSGDAAVVQREFERFVGDKDNSTWWKYTRSVLTTGVQRIAETAGGRNDAEADLAISAGHESAVEQTGIQLVLRLRERGSTLREIHDATPQALADILKHQFNQTVPPDDAARLRRSISAAFQNVDVRRLLAGTPQEFDVDRGKSYFSSETPHDYGLSDHFAGWSDRIGDAVSVANVSMMFGPSAAVGRVGARLVGLVRTAEEYEQLAEVRTLGETVASLARLNQLGQAIGQTRTGRFVLQHLTRFEETASTVDKLAASAVFQTGIVAGAGYVGGRPAELAGEVLTALGVGDVGATAKLLRGGGTSAAAVEAVAGRLRAGVRQVEEAAAVNTATYGAKIIRGPPQEIESTVRELEAATRSSLERAVEGEATRAVALEHETHRLLRDSAQATKNSDAELTRKMLARAEAVEKTALAETARTRKNIEAIDRLQETVRKPPAEPTVRDPGTAPTVRIRGDVPRANGDPTRARSVYAAEAELAAPSRSIEAPAAQGAGQVVVIENPRSPGSAEAMARARAREVLVQEEINAALDRMARAKFFAHQDDVTKRFDAADITRVESMPLERMIPVKDVQGRPGTAADPRFVPGGSGSWVAVFKPAGQRNNVDAELAAYELNTLLGIETPAAARVTVRDAIGAAHEGVVVRYAQGHDFQGGPLGEWTHARKEVAESILSRQMIGDYDIKSDNFFLLAEGRVMPIDHGLGDPLGKRLGEQALGRTLPDVTRITNTQLENLIRQDMESSIIHARKYYPSADFVMQDITLDHFAEKLQKLNSLPEDQVRDAFKRIYGSDTDAIETAWRLFKVRRQLLPDVLKKYFPPKPPMPARVGSLVSLLLAA